VPNDNVKRIRYFLEAQLVRSFAWLTPRLPRSLILFFARTVGTLAYCLDSRGRRTALENLRVAFGDQYTPHQRAQIARRSYQTFARTFIDLFWARSLTRTNWQSHVEIQLDDPAAENQARETGAIWVTPHFGNFEFVSLIWGFRDIKFNVVAQDFKNPALTEIFTTLRQHSGHQVISSDGAMLRLIKSLKRQGHAGLLTDLNMKPGRATTVIECFGLKTCVPTLHTTLAQRLGLSIITGVCIPWPNGTYRVQIFSAIRPTPEEDVTAITQQVWDHFEKAIRQHPECWMWMYKHWRYLPTENPDPAYPNYANPSGAFRKLLTSS
jgi:Kdo2-lipid IVA lauroyltransferase/acyltransferase